MKRDLALTNCTIYTSYDILYNNAILISNGKVVEIVANENIPNTYEIVDLNGHYVSPGLIDLQIYGTGDQLFSAELTQESLLKIDKDLIAQGCTTYCLTLATNTLAVFKEAIEVYKKSTLQACMGLHLEGPFLNSKKRGAHPEELIIKADLTQLESLFHEAEGVIKIMTVAPEEFDASCIDYLKSKDVLISAGHSNSTLEEATESFNAGIDTVTHLWNAMSPLHHREVGLPGAAFNHDKVRASIIVDGIHVDYEAVKLSKQIMKERLFLITDAVASCSKGIYQHILNDDHYVLPDGTLSGSALTLLQAVANMVNKVGVELDEALRMATLYPADLIKRNDIGRIEKGARANILVFNNAFEVESVYIDGALV